MSAITRRRCLIPCSRRRPSAAICRASSSEDVPDVTYDLVARNQALFRGLPLWAGATGLAGLLANHWFSGIAPVADASSGQSRVDVLTIVLSAVLLLTGLQWLSLKPKAPAAVKLDGQAVDYVDRAAKLPLPAVQEMQWAWQSLRSTARVSSMLVMYEGRPVFAAGLLQRGVAASSARPGDVCRQALESGKGNYLANLVLYPGRLEFTAYLPEATQGVLVQPIGSRALLVLGSDTVRGLSRLDQAWAAMIADKLEVTLEGYVAPGVGFGGGTGSSSSSTAGVVSSSSGSSNRAASSTAKQ